MAATGGTHCAPSHLLQKMRGSDIVTTGEGHCLAGTNAGVQSGKSPLMAYSRQDVGGTQRKEKLYAHENAKITRALARR